jgi:hypothetical protein
MVGDSRAHPATGGDLNVLFSTSVQATGSRSGPDAVREPLTRGYRIEAPGPHGAEVAATQLMLADLGSRGMRLTGPPTVQVQVDERAAPV